MCSLTDTRAPVAEKDLRQRRAGQQVADQAHAARVQERQNALSAKWRRERRRKEAEGRGRTVRPYRRKAPAEPETST